MHAGIIVVSHELAEFKIEVSLIPEQGLIKVLSANCADDSLNEWAYCWAHVRRKYFEFEKNFSEQCKEILDLIDELSALERNAKSFEDLRRLRPSLKLMLMLRTVTAMTANY